MRDWIKDIKEKTANMNKTATAMYVLTYYWYHILIFLAVFALIFIFIFHYATNKTAIFTCAMVNQQVDTKRDELWTKEFAKEIKEDAKKIVIDSNYNFSYGDMQLEGVNESSYEKFFLQWRNKELDAVIVSESFYKYCKELGGEFRDLSKWDTGALELYKDENAPKAVVIGTDEFTKKVTGKTDEKLLLAFPDTGKHEKLSQLFLKYSIKKFNYS